MTISTDELRIAQSLRRELIEYIDRMKIKSVYLSRSILVLTTFSTILTSVIGILVAPGFYDCTDESDTPIETAAFILTVIALVLQAILGALSGHKVNQNFTQKIANAAEMIRELWSLENNAKNEIDIAKLQIISSDLQRITKRTMIEL